MDVTQDMIYEYIRKKGGRVKNVDLVKHFRKHLQFEDAKKKEQAREAFKETVNAVAVIRQEEGEKFLYMKDAKQTGTALKRTSMNLHQQPNAILDPQLQRQSSGVIETLTSTSTTSQSQLPRRSSGMVETSTSSSTSLRSDSLERNRRPPPSPPVQNTNLTYTGSVPNLPNGHPSVITSQHSVPSKLHNGLGPSSEYGLEERSVAVGNTSPRRALLSPPASSSKANRTSFVVTGSPKHQSSPAPPLATSSLGGSNPQIHMSPVRHGTSGAKKTRGSVDISGPVNLVSLSNGLSNVTDSPPDSGSSMLEQMTMELQSFGSTGLFSDLTSSRISPPRELITATRPRPASAAPFERSSTASATIHPSAPSSSSSASLHSQQHPGLAQQTSPQHRPVSAYSTSPQHHASPTHRSSPQHASMLSISQVASSSSSTSSDGQDHASAGLGVKQLIDKYSPGSPPPVLVDGLEAPTVKVFRSSSNAGQDHLAIRREGTPPDGISVRRAMSSVGTGGGTLRRSKLYADNLQNITRQSIKGIPNRTKLQHRLSKNSEDFHEWPESFSVPVQDSASNQHLGEEGDRDSPSYQDEYIIEIDPLEKEWIMALNDGNLELIHRLIMEDSTYINRRGFLHGWTALHWAARLGKKDLVNALILSGARVDIRSNGGMTPLHLACESGHNDVIENLVADHNASVNLRERSGKRPVDVVSDGVPEHIKGLLRNGLTHFNAPRNASLAIAIGPLKSFNIPRSQQVSASPGTLQKRWASVGNVQDKEVSVDKVKKHKQHHLLSPPGVRKGFSFRRQKRYTITKDGKSS